MGTILKGHREKDVTSKMIIEWSIRLGDILVLLALIGTVVTIAFRAGAFAQGLREMQREIVELKQVASAVATVLTTVAVQKTELEHLRIDIDDLKHGRGFIRSAPRDQS